MGIIFMLLGGICYLGGFVCSIIILIDAFKNAVWKGIVYLLCGLYGLYYALVEFQHEKKWLIIGGAVGLSILGAIFMAMGGAGAASAMPVQ